MKRIDLDVEIGEAKDWIGKKPEEKDVLTCINEPCQVFLRDSLRIVYAYADWDTAPMQEAIRKIKFIKSARSNGLQTVSRIFGYAPRIAHRNDFCHSTSLAKESPREHGLICENAKKMAELYQTCSPELYQHHQRLTDKILKSYRMAGTMFTSGIINKNNPLFYHLDAGNFQDVWSAMIVFKKATEGGMLSCPTLGIKFNLDNNAIILFEVQSLVHGVTPIIAKHRLSYRYSIVYYSLRAMWQCLDINAEIERAQIAKTTSARNKNKRIAARGKA